MVDQNSQKKNQLLRQTTLRKEKRNPPMKRLQRRYLIALLRPQQVLSGDVYGEVVWGCCILVEQRMMIQPPSLQGGNLQQVALRSGVCPFVTNFIFTDDVSRSIETLVRYLADRRPKLRAALEAVNITPESQSHFASPLSEATIDELFGLPNAPLSALTPEQLLRFAQLVDTALYKSYLVIRPALLGPLCRIANWCEVSEVEEDLRNRKVRHSQLLFLFRRLNTHHRQSCRIEICGIAGFVSWEEDALQGS